MSNRRVVVTGIGLVSSLGIGTSENWSALTAGRSGVGTITKFDASQFATQIAGEVRGFNPLDFIEKKDVKKMDVFIQYAVAASQFTMDDGSKVTPDVAHGWCLHRFGHRRLRRSSVSTALLGRPPKDFLLSPSAIINLAAGQVSIRYGERAQLATCTACSASAHAIGDA